MKLWLDDIREPSSDWNPSVQDPSEWTWVKTAKDAISHVLTGTVEEISFDHDLGASKAGTGQDVARKIEELAEAGKIPPIKWYVHSYNPVGKANITASMKSAERFWSASEALKQL